MYETGRRANTAIVRRPLGLSFQLSFAPSRYSLSDRACGLERKLRGGRGNFLNATPFEGDRIDPCDRRGMPPERVRDGLVDARSFLELLERLTGKAAPVGTITTSARRLALEATS